jgi:hypothetical protein
VPIRELRVNRNRPAADQSESLLAPERALKTLKAVLVGESTVGKTIILAVANTGRAEC